MAILQLLSENGGLNQHTQHATTTLENKSKIRKNWAIESTLKFNCIRDFFLFLPNTAVSVITGFSFDSSFTILNLSTLDILILQQIKEREFQNALFIHSNGMHSKQVIIWSLLHCCCVPKRNLLNS